MAVIIILAVAAPLKIFYPMSQDNYLEQRAQMLEQRAAPTHRPSTIKPDAKPGEIRNFMRLAQRGYGVSDIINWRLFEGRTYLVTLAESAWGVFGWMNVYAPTGIYLLVLAILLFMALLNARSLLIQRAATAGVVRVFYLSCLLTLILGVAATLWFSLYYDLQAQGRYLYPAFAALLFAVCGCLPHEEGRAGVAAQYAGLALFCLAQFTLWRGCFQLIRS